MIQRATAVFTEIVKGLLRFGLDRLGNTGADDPANAPSGLTVEACHPYGFRSRPRDPDADANGVPTKGAGLLLLDFGGGDEGGIPTQDPRVELADEGKGGAQLYAWTGSAVSSIVLSGDDGKVRVTAPETIIGSENGAKALVKDELLMQWITGTLIPALANSPGGPISVAPPSGLGTTKTRAE